MENYDIYKGIARQFYQLAGARDLLWEVMVGLEDNYDDGVLLDELCPEDKRIDYMEAWVKDSRCYIKRIEKALNDYKRTKLCLNNKTKTRATKQITVDNNQPLTVDDLIKRGCFVCCSPVKLAETPTNVLLGFLLEEQGDSAIIKSTTLASIEEEQ